MLFLTLIGGALFLLAPGVLGWYRPHPGTVFQWQLEVDDSNPVDFSMQADLWDVDLWGVSESDISAIHAKGGKVICYFSAGTYDHNRPDAGRFPHGVLGNTMADWPDERWLDIRSPLIRPIMMARMDLAVRKRCDGIEPDNVDAHEVDNNPGFPISYNEQLVYNQWLATEAHKRDLSIGLKNDAEQIPELHRYFDWALNEQCHSTRGECDEYKPFLNENKAVFNVEYVSSKHVSAHDQQKCHGNPVGMQTQFKLEDVTSWTWRCHGQ